ncbi:MAG: DUF3347 domain-containing protein [Verrucomicrobia bacterium]|nr:DUF3347 domain-containing protein [Verrucomicrobiota bacterium]
MPEFAPIDYCLLPIAYAEPKRGPMRSVCSLLIALVAVFSLSACGGGKAKKPATSVSAADKNVIAAYEEVREALTQDDLRKARAAGGRLTKAVEAAGVSAALAKAAMAPAKAIAESSRIDNVRGAYKDVSKAIVEVAGEVEGYYVFESPMIVEGLWLQTSPQPSNPYLGRALSTLGNPK